MKIHEIRWDEDTIWHIARHGVEPQEVEDVCFKSKPLIMKSRYNRYYAFGQTQNGRYLTVIFSYLGRNRAKIITARAMSDVERRNYQRR